MLCLNNPVDLICYFSYQQWNQIWSNSPRFGDVRVFDYSLYRGMNISQADSIGHSDDVAIDNVYHHRFRHRDNKSSNAFYSRFDTAQCGQTKTPTIITCLQGAIFNAEKGKIVTTLLVLYIYVEGYTNKHACTDARTHARTHTCTHTHTHARTHAHTHTLLHTFYTKLPFPILSQTMLAPLT